MKTIKFKKIMRLDELIGYIYDNEIKDKEFRCLRDLRNIKVDLFGAVRFDYGFDSEDLFSVEVKKEVEKDDDLLGVQEVFLDLESGELEVEIHPPSQLKTIRDVLLEHDSSTECRQIYARFGDSIKLVWEADSDERD